MDVTVGDIVVWLIVGALAGSLAGFVVTRKREGFGRYVNLGVGLVGALIGGLIFHVFKIDLGLDDLTITFEDLISALLGSMIFLGLLWWVRRWWNRKG
jgi:uncharacterized membrane protein YeaQ/YmgE (transglycosylase-associated protein family)